MRGMSELNKFLLDYYSEHYRKASEELDQIKEKYFEKSKKSHEETELLRKKYEDLSSKKRAISELISDIVAYNVYEIEEKKEDEANDGKRFRPDTGDRKDKDQTVGEAKGRDQKEPERGRHRIPQGI